jgi:hypothetical protein
MRNPTLTHLREAVRSEITQAFDSLGFAKPRDIAKLVCTANQESIAAIGAQLAENAITDVVRRELKNSTKSCGSSMQMLLPGVPEVMARLLPPSISIPSEDDSNDEGVIYKPLAKVTFGELGAHLDMLTSQIRADISRHRALTELHDMAEAMGAIGDSCVFDVLGASDHLEVEVA